MKPRSLVPFIFACTALLSGAAFAQEAAPADSTLRPSVFHALENLAAGANGGRGGGCDSGAHFAEVAHKTVNDLKEALGPGASLKSTSDLPLLPLVAIEIKVESQSPICAYGRDLDWLQLKHRIAETDPLTGTIYIDAKAYDSLDPAAMSTKILTLHEYVRTTCDHCFSNENAYTYSASIEHALDKDLVAARLWSVQREHIAADGQSGWYDQTCKAYVRADTKLHTMTADFMDCRGGMSRVSATFKCSLQDSAVTCEEKRPTPRFSVTLFPDGAFTLTILGKHERNWQFY